MHIILTLLQVIFQSNRIYAKLFQLESAFEYLHQSVPLQISQLVRKDDDNDIEALLRKFYLTKMAVT